MQSKPTLPKLLVYGQTDRGNQRPNNEDTLAWTHISASADQHPGTGVHMQIAQSILQSHGCLFVVADGVGGNTDGELASHTAVCDTLSSFYSLPLAEHQQQLDAALHHATMSVHKLAQARACNAASTLVAALIWDEDNEHKVLFSNVGDSPGWIIRAAENDTAYLQTIQHIENQTLQQSIGDPQVEPHFSSTQTLHKHDWIVLCSDGLSDLVSIAEITAIIKLYSPKRVCKQLIALAKQRGGHDNITVLLIRNGKPAPTSKIWTAFGVILICFVLIGWSWSSGVPSETSETTNDSLAIIDWKSEHHQATSTLSVWEQPELNPEQQLELQPSLIRNEPSQAYKTASVEQRIATQRPTSIPTATIIQPTQIELQPSPSLQPVSSNNPTDITYATSSPTLIESSATAIAFPNPTKAPEPEIPMPTQHPIPTATMLVEPTHLSVPPTMVLPTSPPATPAPSSTNIPPTEAPTITSPPASLVPEPTKLTGPPIEIPPTETPD